MDMADTTCVRQTRHTTPNHGNETMRTITTPITKTRVRLNGVVNFELYRVFSDGNGGTILHQCNRKTVEQVTEVYTDWLSSDDTLEVGCVRN